MSIKVFQTNANGRIEFTRCELEKLLNETYNEGYHAGENQAKGQYWTWAPNWGTLITNDSTNNRITTANTTNAIDDLKCTTKISDNNCAKTAIETNATPINHNGAKATTTTRINDEAPRTYTIDLSKNLDSMAKIIEEILCDHPKQSVQTDPFTSLAKELKNL